jgi:hypothetical protein
MALHDREQVTEGDVIEALESLKGRELSLTR